MSALSPGQIYNLARDAGFHRFAAATATAIALAESGGRPDAHADTAIEDSRGLWQINVRAHPQFSGWNLYDPATNARAAFAVSNGGRNWAPWSTYGTAAVYGPGHTNAAAGELSTVYSALGIQHGGHPPDRAAADPVKSKSGDQPGSNPTGVGGNVENASAAGDAAGKVLDLLNPLHWADNIASAFTAIYNDFKGFALKGIVLTGAAGLLVVGLSRTVSPTVSKVQSEFVGPVPDDAAGGAAAGAGGAGAAAGEGAAAGGAASTAAKAAVVL